jgi:hypothetical protein
MQIVRSRSCVVNLGQEHSSSPRSMGRSLRRAGLKRGVPSAQHATCIAAQRGSAAALPCSREADDERLPSGNVLQIQHDGQITTSAFRKACQDCKQKIFRFSEHSIRAIRLPVRATMRDVSRSSRNVVRVAMDAAASGGLARRAKRSQRTAKSCGPGAATVASIRPACAGPATVTRTAAHRGEHV